MLGDLNLPSEKVDKKLKQVNGILRYAPVGSAVSRFSMRESMAALDHILVTPMMYDTLLKPQVQWEYSVSNHRPMVSWIHKTPIPCKKPAPVLRVDRLGIHRHSEALAHDNMWVTLLAGKDIELLEALSAFADHFAKVDNAVQRKYGIKCKTSVAEDKLPHKLKHLLDTSKLLEEKVSKQLAKGILSPDTNAEWR